MDCHDIQLPPNIQKLYISDSSTNMFEMHLSSLRSIYIKFIYFAHIELELFHQIPNLQKLTLPSSLKYYDVEPLKNCLHLKILRFHGGSKLGCEFDNVQELTQITHLTLGTTDEFLLSAQMIHLRHFTLQLPYYGKLTRAQLQNIASVPNLRFLEFTNCGEPMRRAYKCYRKHLPASIQIIMQKWNLTSKSI